MRVETIGLATLYLGDCREVLPKLPKADAVVTDPPYGIAGSWKREKTWQGSCGKGRLWDGEPEWDTPPDEKLLTALATRPAIVWGGNYMTGLPVSKGWLVWDKAADMTQAQAELAWTNCAPNIRVFRKSPLGVFGNRGTETKEHPVQKPLELMRWCLGFVPNECRTILDPFMGAGTTGVAAVETGRLFVGIEQDAGYYEIACRRLKDAQRQSSMFMGDAA